jgi:thiosulfate dehydrogenase
MARRQVGCKNASAVTRYRGDGMSGTTDALFLTQLGICIPTSETQYQVCTMVSILRSVRVLLFACAAMSVQWTGSAAGPADGESAAAAQSSIWTVPEVGALPQDAHGRLVRRGRDLITATYAYVGPEVPDTADRYAGNNLACGNCHLQAGTKKFGIPLFGLFGEYPRYNARSGAGVTLEERVNGCMERSMNGRAMPADAQSMQAILAYVQFLSTGVPAGQELPGLGVGKMPELTRAADPERGRPIYMSACAACHAPDGLGVRRSLPTVDLGYMMPPLWGPDSFNDGAGMARLITAANFVHFNMPHGTDYLNPQLAPEEAWDVAAYVLSQDRPHKSGLDHDYPDLLQKPVDTPYGRYADGFSEQQHKYGPFAPIREAIARLKADGGDAKR